MSRVELQKKWWISNRPRNVKGAELEKALGLAERAGDEERAAALGDISPAIGKACKELDKTLHKDLLKDLAALQDLAEAEAKKLLAAARGKAAAAKAGAKRAAADTEDSAAEDKLFDPELHRHTLRRALRQDLVFAFAVGTRPADRMLALAARGNPAAFARLAKARSGGVKVCFGRAQAASAEASTLVLTLDGPPVSGIEKAFVTYLREHKINLFRSVCVKGRGDDGDPAA